MKLIAKKPCNFGRKYFIGEEIPAECVLDPKALEKMGMIEVVEEDDSNVDPTAGGPLLPPASTLEGQDGSQTENQDGNPDGSQDGNPDGSQDGNQDGNPDEVPEKNYSKNK